MGKKSDKNSDIDPEITFTGELKEAEATLDTEKIRQADRATFLLNYLFVVLRNN